MLLSVLLLLIMAIFNSMYNDFLSKKPVIVCVGTTSVVGDSLGPRVGDLLVYRYDVDAFVYGKSSLPVNGVNYDKYISHIRKHHTDSVIIAIDACLGAKDEIGSIKYTFGGLRAGAALNKNLDKIGHLTILGIVAERCANNLESLMKAERTLVEEMSEAIAKKVISLTAALASVR